MAPEEEVARAAALLGAKIRAMGTTQVEVERRLGWSRGYLSQLKTGRAELKLRQLYAVLEAIGLPAADFFTELYGLDRPAAEDYPSLGGEPVVDREALRRVVEPLVEEAIAAALERVGLVRSKS